MNNEKILVVEFEENSLNTLMQNLQSEGFQVVTAKDGHEGLLMFESENPDLVILEPMLLKLHGFDLCRKISIDSDKDTPVIITTGFYKGEHYKSEAIDTFGAAAFFEKPYKSEELMRTVHELLGNGTADSTKEIKLNVQEKEAPALDIEKTVEEMEKSIKEKKADYAAHEQNKDDFAKEKEKSGIRSRVDEMLQDALSDFGLNIEKKPSPQKSEEMGREEIPAVEEPQEKNAEQAVEKEDEDEDKDKELETEELIEELIQKEENVEIPQSSEEEEEPEIQAVAQDAQEKVEDTEKDIEDIQEKIKVVEDKEEVIHEEIEEKQAEEKDQEIFEDYFEEPEKKPVTTKLFGFIQKIKSSLPLMIGSSAFVVLIAVGATYYFLRPNKPVNVANQRKTETIPNVQRSATPSEQQEAASFAPAGNENAQSESLRGPNLQGAGLNPMEKTSADDFASDPPEVPESTAEFMSTTGLSSQQRQVMLPEGMASPESRPFEVIEVEETGEEQLGQSEVEISSPLLDEAAKNIIQSDNVSERIKVGDLVPIETVDVPPVATKKINPKYPPAAYQRGIEETVVFRALISEFGNVLDVAFVDSSKVAPAFRKSCDEAIRKWRFSPAKKGGVNVKVWKTFSIAFKKNKTE
jgi:TonB family protein